MTLAEGLAYEAALFGLCFSTADKNEGTRAFLEKRAPQFKGSVEKASSGRIALPALRRRSSAGVARLSASSAAPPVVQKRM